MPDDDLSGLVAVAHAVGHPAQHDRRDRGVDLVVQRPDDPGAGPVGPDGPEKDRETPAAGIGELAEGARGNEPPSEELDLHGSSSAVRRMHAELIPRMDADPPAASVLAVDDEPARREKAPQRRTPTGEEVEEVLDDEPLGRDLDARRAGSERLTGRGVQGHVNVSAHPKDQHRTR